MAPTLDVPVLLVSKNNMNKWVMRPVMLMYGSEGLALKKKCNTQKLSVETKMLRWSSGAKRRDKVGNDVLGEAASVSAMKKPELVDYNDMNIIDMNIDYNDINIARKKFPKMIRHISHIGKHFFC